MKLSELDLNLLVPLEALLTERNISRAAVRVGASQSAMSKTLRRLRAKFGDDLLIRVGQEYCLSPFAEEIIPELRQVIATLEQTLNRRPRFDPTVDRQLFRVATTDALEYLVVKPLIERIARRTSAVSLELHAVDGDATLDLIRLGELDLCLTPVAYHRSNLSQQLLFPDRRVCAVWNEVPGIGERLTFDQLFSLPHAAYDWTGYDVHNGDYTEWGFLDRLPIRVTDVRLLMRLFMLRGTSLVTFTWETLGRSVADMAEIRLVEPPFEPTIAHHRMLWHPRNTSNPAHRWLRCQIESIARSVDCPSSTCAS